MHQPYRLGLDVGTNSIGWAALTLDAAGKPNGILALGARIYSDGRNPKDGTSLAVARREPRGMRRRRDRYLRRRDDLMEMLIALNLMPADETERHALITLDPYELRAKAANGPLAPHELGRALFHLDQRRGFKSNRKTDTSDDNKLTDKIEALDRSIKQSGAETLGEYLHRRRLKGKMVRARPEAGFYPLRAMYEKEFDRIQEIQAAHHTLRPDQWAQLRDIMFWQRPLRPVDPGWCLLEEGARRAHRAMPCAQEFRMVQEAQSICVFVAARTKPRLTRNESRGPCRRRAWSRSWGSPIDNMRTLSPLMDGRGRPRKRIRSNMSCFEQVSQRTSRERHADKSFCIKDLSAHGV
jgi:CRISPR-associated endonuclease Csn1